jgi:hypothetical protein
MQAVARYARRNFATRVSFFLVDLHFFLPRLVDLFVTHIYTVTHTLTLYIVPLSFSFLSYPHFTISL